MGIPGNFIDTSPEPEIRTDAKPKLDRSDGADSGYAHPGDAFQRDSGLWALEPGTLHAWIKLAGEPAEPLYETPLQFHERWKAFIADETQSEVWFHTHTDGAAFAIYRPGIPHLWKFGVTYQSTPPRPHARSIWEGNCDCPLCTAGG